MKTKHTKPGQTNNKVLREIPRACTDETAAVEFMEKQRWGNIPACPRCGCIEVHKMKGNNGKRNKRFLWRCHGCKKQFSPCPKSQYSSVFSIKNVDTSKQKSNSLKIF